MELNRFPEISQLLATVLIREGLIIPENTNNQHYSRIMNQPDTIAALATPVGRGGIGIIRISGFQVTKIARTLLG